MAEATQVADKTYQADGTQSGDIQIPENLSLADAEFSMVGGDLGALPMICHIRRCDSHVPLRYVSGVGNVRLHEFLNVSKYQPV